MSKIQVSEKKSVRKCNARIQFLSTLSNHQQKICQRKNQNGRQLSGTKTIIFAN